MNRLILIGNGFDLAHDLKTDYNSFILWYLKKCLTEAFQNKTTNKYEDELILVNSIYPAYQFGVNNAIPNISDLVNHYYISNLGPLLSNDRLYIGSNSHLNPFRITIKSNFVRNLILTCSNSNWVDIENEFYDQLKKCLPERGNVNFKLLEELNKSLKSIIEQLELYLSTLKYKKFSPAYSNILTSDIITNDIIFNNSDVIGQRLYQNEPPRISYVLDFNYTRAIEEYFKSHDNLPLLETPIQINHIHGEINNENNPLIFGFGDELDDDYKKMELSKANGFFEYIKSFWYFKTSNYHDLIRFIESGDYQIYILGHSCGLSDRTLLNMLFEHRHCRSIKIYYHGDKKKNNYTTLTQEISRHFKDKVAMRSKIVPFDKSEPMPQVE